MHAKAFVDTAELRDVADTERDYIKRLIVATKISRGGRQVKAVIDKIESEHYVRKGGEEEEVRPYWRGEALLELREQSTLGR